MSKKADDRAARAAALRAEQARSERRRRLSVIGAVVAVLVVIVGVGYWVQSTRDTTGDAPAATPSGVTDGYSVFVGDEDAATVITVYEDLQCPVCRDFEAATAEPLSAAVDAGDARVEYRLVSFLDDASTNDYSSRALNALMVTLDTAGLEAFRTMHEALFAAQPAEGGPGPEDDALIEAAVAAGADEDTVSGPIEDKVFDQWIVNATEQMSKNGVNGTPTVLIDGERVEGSVPEQVEAVLAAIG